MTWHFDRNSRQITDPWSVLLFAQSSGFCRENFAKDLSGRRTSYFAASFVGLLSYHPFVGFHFDHPFVALLSRHPTLVGLFSYYPFVGLLSLHPTTFSPLSTASFFHLVLCLLYLGFFEGIPVASSMLDWRNYKPEKKFCNNKYLFWIQYMYIYAVHSLTVRWTRTT